MSQPKTATVPIEPLQLSMRLLKFGQSEPRHLLNSTSGLKDMVIVSIGSDITPCKHEGFILSEKGPAMPGLFAIGMYCNSASKNIMTNGRAYHGVPAKPALWGEELKKL